MTGEKYDVKAEVTQGMIIGDKPRVTQHFNEGNKTSPLALVVVLALVIIAVIGLLIFWAMYNSNSKRRTAGPIPAQQATPTTASMHPATSFTAPLPTSTWTQTPTAIQTTAATPTATPSQPIIVGFLVTYSDGFTSTIKARGIITVVTNQIIFLRPQLPTSSGPENISCLWNARAQSRGRVSPTDSCTASYQAPDNTGADFITVAILKGGEQIDWNYMHIQVEAP